MSILNELSIHYPNEWLILFELFNVIKNNDQFLSIKNVLINKLKSIEKNNKEHSVIITRGIEIISNSIATSVT